MEAVSSHPNPAGILVNSLRQVVDPEMNRLYEMVTDPTVKSILDGAYAVNPLLDNSAPEEWLYHKTYKKGIHATFDGSEFVPERFTVAAARMAVSSVIAMERYADEFYENGNHADQDPFAGIVAALRQGQEKIVQFGFLKNSFFKMNENGLDYGGIGAAFLPLWLAKTAVVASRVRMGGDEAHAAQSMMESAAFIKDGGTYRITKTMQPIDEAFARTMNMLGALYFRGTTRDFYTNFFEADFYRLRIESVASSHLPPSLAPPHTGPPNAAMTRFMREDGEIFGITGMDMSEVSDTIARRIKKHSSQYPTSKEFGAYTLSRMRTMLAESQRVLVARNTLQMLATGGFDWGAVANVSALADSTPLKDRVITRPPISERLVDWEVVPRGIGQGRPHSRTGAPPKDTPPAGVDMDRRDRMYGYVDIWGDGYVVRSRIPNLKEADQYYVAILPQIVGELVLEHAVGDNPSEQRNAVYAWRAESGIGRFGQVQWDWEKVYSQYKTIMRWMGARRILHTPTVESRILEYLTRPVENLRKQGYDL